MLVSKISPAPSATALCAHSIASAPVSMRPPLRKTLNEPFSLRFASIATTTHCEPNLSAASVISSGRRNAAELTLILSAPSDSNLRKCSTELMPPPTVRGMKTCSAARAMTSYIVLRPSCVAVMSRKTISSARIALYALAASTGSPASMRLTKLTPLTTRPSRMSRQGMILFASIRLPPRTARPPREGRSRRHISLCPRSRRTRRANAAAKGLPYPRRRRWR